MVFSSIIFLCIFMPIIFGIYYICPRSLRNIFLLIASLIFYAWGEPKYILIMLFSTVFDYTNGRIIEHYKQSNNVKLQKLTLAVSIIGNLSILCFFKYTDFFITFINDLCSTNISLINIALPIGISFYTFQTMSYTIDVYRERVKAQHNILDFGMYVCLFPQLIAGPIVRYEQVENNIKDRTISAENAAYGLQRFAIGLGKKVILANQIGALWDNISAMNLSQLSLVSAWLGAISFTLQIYFDFSGYSDMAIGMGKMLGFNFPENFNYPYMSENITEFWRRWHITLGQWFKEYVYIPLGGNKNGLVRQFLNIFIVWILTGFWHGANWNFVLWGFYFFIILTFEKTFLIKTLNRLPKAVGHIYSLILIIFGWVIFACEDFTQLINYIKALFGIGVKIINNTAIYNLYTNILLIILLSIAATNIPSTISKHIKAKLEEKYKVYGKQIFFWLNGIYCIFLLIISIILLVSGTYNPFLYFRF